MNRISLSKTIWSSDLDGHSKNFENSKILGFEDYGID